MGSVCKTRYVNWVTDRYGVKRAYYRPKKGFQLPSDIKSRLSDDPSNHPQDIERLNSLVVRRKVQPSTKKEFLEDVLKEVIRSTKKRSKQKGIFYTVTDDFLFTMLRRQKYKCSLSGINFTSVSGKYHNSFRAPYRPSIDRIDPQKGYAADNVRLVCVAINVALSDWGEDVFLQIAQGYLNGKSNT